MWRLWGQQNAAMYSGIWMMCSLPNLCSMHENHACNWKLRALGGKKVLSPQNRAVPSTFQVNSFLLLPSWDAVTHQFLLLGPVVKEAKCKWRTKAKHCYCFALLSLQLLIKLKTKTNTDYFLECCSREERDSWALDITGAIHAGHPVQVQELHRMKNSFKLLENISLQ